MIDKNVATREWPAINKDEYPPEKSQIINNNLSIHHTTHSLTRTLLYIPPTPKTTHKSLSHIHKYLPDLTLSLFTQLLLLPWPLYSTASPSLASPLPPPPPLIRRQDLLLPPPLPAVCRSSKALGFHPLDPFNRLLRILPLLPPDSRSVVALFAKLKIPPSMVRIVISFQCLYCLI